MNNQTRSQESSETTVRWYRVDASGERKVSCAALASALVRFDPELGIPRRSPAAWYVSRTWTGLVVTRQEIVFRGARCHHGNLPPCRQCEWGAWPGAVYGLISRGKAKGVRIPAPSTIEVRS